MEVFIISSEREFMRFLRVYKHDFLNHLQVVLGYLQLKKPERALEYLKEAIEEVEKSGSVMRLGLPSVAFWLLLEELKQKEQGIIFQLTNDTDFIASEEQEQAILTCLKPLVEEIGCTIGNLPYEKRAWCLNLTGRSSLNLLFTLPRLEGLEWENIFKAKSCPEKGLKLNTSGWATEENYFYRLEFSIS